MQDECGGVFLGLFIQVSFSSPHVIPTPTAQDDVVAFEANLAVKGDVTIAMWFTDHYSEVWQWVAFQSI